MAKKISFYTISSIYFFAFVAFVMALVMDTAKDRKAYIRIFENPFGNSRIEVGFQYYVYFFDIINSPAFLSIVLTCVLIYFLWSRVWFFFIRCDWLVSILLFNFFAFGLMNYYLGTSIRMGLAIGLALYASIKILQSKKIYWLPLFASFFIHYGAILYILVFTWVYALRLKKIKLHFAIICFASVALLAFFDKFIPYLNLSTYYMGYIEGDLGRTDRIFPFTIAFSLISIVLIFNKISISLKEHPTLTILVIYSIPFLLFYIVTGNPLFGKMLMPIIFLQAIILVLLYIKFAVRLLGRSLFVFCLMGLNLVAICYALKMYNLI